MSRPIELSRDEAEMLVDLCEGSRSGLAWDIAAKLREQWGMGPQGEMPAVSTDDCFIPCGKCETKPLCDHASECANKLRSHGDKANE